MNHFLRSSCALAMMVAVSGCGGDEGPPADAKPDRRATGPEETAPVKGGKAAPKGAMRSDMNAPVASESGTEGPRLEGPKTDATKPAAAAVKLSDDELKGIKELPADEQAAAIAQAECPVSSEHLGAMGKPLKVAAEGRTFYLCCKSCEKEVKADPKAVFAKLDKK
jgi:YHS domain-containing protein